MLALAFRIPSEASTSDDGVEMDTKSFIEAETTAGTEIDTNSVIEAETLPGNEMDKKFLIEAETLASVQMDTKSASSDSFPVLRTATALAVSLAICKLGSCLTTYFGFQGGSLPAVAAIVVVLATIFPKKLEHLAQSGEAMAMILMQLYFTEVGARANIWTVNCNCKTPSIFIFSILQLASCYPPRTDSWIGQALSLRSQDVAYCIKCQRWRSYNSLWNGYSKRVDFHGCSWHSSWIFWLCHSNFSSHLIWRFSAIFIIIFLQAEAHIFFLLFLDF